MKKTILIFSVLLLTFQFTAQADEARVLKIEPASTPSEPALVYLDSGRVLRVDSSDEKTLMRLKVLQQSGDPIRFEGDFVGEAPAEAHPQFRPLQAPVQAPPEYTPTDFQTYENAHAQFRRLSTRMRRRSQCYQRAENWVYEMWQSGRVYSMKIFMFFTRRYIRDYQYGWWFHVTPVVEVAGTDYTLDPTFTSDALPVPKWTSYFMPRNVTCARVEKYSDYENHQEEQLCYHIRVPMYYYQPLNVEAMEKGEFVTDWIPWELAHAARAYR